MTANLLDFDLEGLAAFCERLGEKRFRATQLFRWIHQKGASDFGQMSDLAKSLRDKLQGAAHIAAIQQVFYAATPGLEAATGGTVQTTGPGKVIAFDLAKTSGRAALDQEALALIQRAQPLPAIPPGYGKDQINAVVPIEFSLH